ncbi:hypothetical protein A3D70_02650 [Candidatus Adlerbacteria bacterium RIFCSPHIGHO2_02_FULL_54_18]|uniref:M23ase beta-sheet core domain-containing protein n=2 Tax=Candidatus Adleribacteriota TaxID=1752736 RepID=A0A1F4Y2M7_9BACT|nr:MAG: hypothetical protein A2949_02325 [Candidatus Adlerbacteria bacterium RIFCSPLOWO2_01_FULL_54_21b]OGC88227.1 MAG: hypothetical protein A3D70_02650 [Candidatus Adlerbacteria bacterium RIFCSPHIGHO2_02_FULL_54_18]
MPRSLLVTALLLALATPAFAQDPSPEIQAQVDTASAQIQKLKDEIAALQKDLNSTTAQKQTLQNAIKALDLQIQKLQKSVTLTTTQMSQKDKEISTLSGDIRTTEEKMGDAKGGIAASLRRLGQTDQEELIIALFGGGTLSGFFDEAVNLASLRSDLQNRVEDLGALRSDLRVSKTSAEARRQELARLKSNLTEQKQGVTTAKADQTTLLTQTKSKESEYQKLIAQKEDEQKSFESELVRLAVGLGPADTSSVPGAARGILSWPLDNVRNSLCAVGIKNGESCFTQYFGNTTFSQSGAYSGNGHNGIDFRASVGTPVRAALSGVVQEINLGAVKNCQYGKWVLVKHKNGLTTLYAHLSNISVSKGQSVGTGELVGYAGNTGYATGPHLHFTVYVSSAVSFKQYTCNSGYTAFIPVAPLNAYLNPLSYLPGL